MTENVEIIGTTETRGDVVREIWRVSVGGQIKTLVTTNSSTVAMDQAVYIYDGALRRLADR
jgi:hypothetical protein